MKKYLHLILSALAAGICIGIGGTVYVSVAPSAKIVAALLFCIGLFIIICYQFALFTGKIGYVFENKPKFLLDLLIIWIGNFLGTILVAMLFRQTRLFTPEMNAYIQSLVKTKGEGGILSVVILSVFCGMLVHLAVQTQKKENIHPAFKLTAIFGCISVFILCGFEHLVADMYYVALAGVWSWKWIGYLLIITIGNGLGALIIWGLDKITNTKKQSE